MCMKCHNGYISKTFDNISVDQRMMPKESQVIWLIIAIIVVVFLCLCVTGAYWIHHKDHKKEDKWRSKYMAERM